MATTSRARGARKVEVGLKTATSQAVYVESKKPTTQAVYVESKKTETQTSNKEGSKNETNSTNKTLILIVVLAIMLFIIYKYTEK